jgi:hypothetical protein
VTAGPAQGRKCNEALVAFRYISSAEQPRWLRGRVDVAEEVAHAGARVLAWLAAVALVHRRQTVGPLGGVTDEFAWVEGEGDRSRAVWLANHYEFFGWQAAREGFVLTGEEPVVFEGFRVVWPVPDA